MALQRCDISYVRSDANLLSESIQNSEWVFYHFLQYIHLRKKIFCCKKVLECSSFVLFEALGQTSLSVLHKIILPVFVHSISVINEKSAFSFAFATIGIWHWNCLVWPSSLDLFTLALPCFLLSLFGLHLHFS